MGPHYARAAATLRSVVRGPEGWCGRAAMGAQAGVRMAVLWATLRFYSSGLTFVYLGLLAYVDLSMLVVHRDRPWQFGRGFPWRSGGLTGGLPLLGVVGGPAWPGLKGFPPFFVRLRGRRSILVRSIVRGCASLGLLGRLERLARAEGFPPSFVLFIRLDSGGRLWRCTGVCTTLS